MKNDEIENRDKELIKKFRTIIRNKKIIEEHPRPKRFPLGLILLLTILIISGLFFLKERPQTLYSQETKASSHGEPVPGKQPAPGAPTGEIKASSHMPESDPPPPKAVERAPVPHSSVSVVTTPVPEKKFPGAISDQKKQGDLPSGIRIEELISCSDINNRQPSSPKIEFSLGQDAAIWMKVISQNPPFTLTHVYYCKGIKYCEVPLAIRYHRMRTWSTVSLRSLEQIGRWRVDVIDENGIKLDQIEFRVVK